MQSRSSQLIGKDAKKYGMVGQPTRWEPDCRFPGTGKEYRSDLGNASNLYLFGKPPGGGRGLVPRPEHYGGAVVWLGDELRGYRREAVVDLDGLDLVWVERGNQLDAVLRR